MFVCLASVGEYAQKVDSSVGFCQDAGRCSNQVSDLLSSCWDRKKKGWLIYETWIVKDPEREKESW